MNDYSSNRDLSPISSVAPHILDRKSTSVRMAESKVAHENYLKQRKDESHKEKTELLAIKSK